MGAFAAERGVILHRTTILARQMPDRYEVFRVVDRCTTPVFRGLADGEPTFNCTGTLLKIADSVILLTAGHSLREHAPFLFRRNGEITPLSNLPSFRTQSLSFADPVTDFACVRLTNSETASVRPESIVPISCADPFEYHNDLAASYLIVGFQETAQRMNHASRVWNHEVTSLLTYPAKREFYGVNRLDRTQTILFDARPSTFRSRDRGSGGAPHMHGMSGSGVWRFDADVVGTYGPPRLAGVFLGRPSVSQRKATMAVRIGPVLEHLSIVFQDLKEHLPEFRAGAS